MFLLSVRPNCLVAQAKPSVEEIIKKLCGKIHLIESMDDVRNAVRSLLDNDYSGLSEREKEEFVSSIASYGLLDDFMRDPSVEDIMINSLNPIFVFDSKKGMVKTSARFDSYGELDLFIQRLLLFSGKARLERINDLHLPDGARANIVFSPLGPQITIRRFKQIPPSIIDLVDWGMLDYHVAAELWLYAEGLGVKPANILIAGAPAAGKTTLLNALFSFFPPNQRTIVIEDTLELNTKTEENCSRLVSGDGLTMEDLVKNSLRMRPDRIIVGEVRGAEAKDLMTAMNIGKICMGTIHAGTSREAVMRLEHEPMNVPTQMIPLVDVIITVGRFMQNGEQFRRITGISEVAGMESGKVLLADRYQFDFQRRKLVELAPSVTYRDRISSASGLSPKEVMAEIERRERILRKLKEKKATSIESVSLFCKKYYERPDEAIKMLGL